MGTDRFNLITRLIAHTNAEVPTDPGFVAEWVRHTRPEDAVQALTKRPGYRVLLPRLFDVDEIGTWIDHEPRWANAIARLAQEGLADRGELLDACLGALRRGPRPGVMRGFLRVHDALAPSPAEQAGRILAYLDLLDSRVSTVAGTAQRVLFALDDRDALDTAARLALATASLRRPEKKLARALLTRVAATPAADLAERASLARVIVESWASADADVVWQGMAVLEALSLPDDALSAIRDHLPAAMPADLAARAATVLGHSAPPPAARAVTVTGEVIGEEAVVVESVSIEPIDGSEDLATALRAAFTSPSEQMTTPRLESLVDGLLRAAARDRETLRREVAPVLDEFSWFRTYHEYSYNRTVDHGVAALAGAAIGEQPHEHPRDPDEPWSGPEAVLVDRLFALATATSLPPLSVALPTSPTGRLSAAALLDRLTQAAGEGWQPPARELDLALLRLRLDDGDETRDAVADRFEALGNAAGRRAAQWLRHALPPEPVVQRRVQQARVYDWSGERRLVGSLRAKLAPGAPSDNVVWNELTAFRNGSGALERYGSPRCWPGLSPAHREVSAAWCVAPLAGAVDASSRFCDVLLELARVDGRMGDATALAFAYGLCAGRGGQRATARDALAVLCRRPEWDGALLGTVLGELADSRMVVIKRVVEPVRDLARGGAATALWPVVRELVAAQLRSTAAQSGFADVLALGAELAQLASVHDTVPGLTSFAARSGRTRQLVEARRLVSLVAAQS